MGGGTPGELSGGWNSMGLGAGALRLSGLKIFLKGQGLGVHKEGPGRQRCCLFRLEGSRTHRSLQEGRGKLITRLGSCLQGKLIRGDKERERLLAGLAACGARPFTIQPSKACLFLLEC